MSIQYGAYGDHQTSISILVPKWDVGFHVETVLFPLGEDVSRNND